MRISDWSSDVCSSDLIFGSAMRESVMIMMIMASAELFAFALSSLYITQSLAAAIAELQINRWALMGLINVFLLVSGMFLPPVAIIVMSAPLLFPIITQAGDRKSTRLNSSH